MSRKFLTALDLAKNELQNAVVQNLGSAPSSPVKGQLYFDSTGNILYWYNGSGWVAAQGGAGAVPATSVTTSAVADSAVVGVATTYAREDHKHGREAFANPTATTTFGLSAVNGSATTLARSDHTHGTPTHDNAAHSAITLNSLAAPTADRTMGGFKITGVGTPVSGTDAANKDYVDNLQAGLSWKGSVRAGTTANITLSAPQTVDGVSVIANDRVLVKNQSTASANGIYTVAAGAWVRATDNDTAAEMEQATVFIEEGTTLADTAWTMSTNGPLTIGTTSLTWVQFGAGTSVIAGAGLVGTTTFDVVAANGSITVAANDIQVGYAGTGTTFGSAVTAARSDHHHDGTYPKKYTLATVGGATSQVITHNLNTQAVLVDVFRTLTPWDTVECDVERTTVNTVTLRFSVAPATNEYTVVVIG